MLFRHGPSTRSSSSASPWSEVASRKHETQILVLNQCTLTLLPHTSLPPDSIVFICLELIIARSFAVHDATHNRLRPILSLASQRDGFLDEPQLVCLERRFVPVVALPKLLSFSAQFVANVTVVLPSCPITLLIVYQTSLSPCCQDFSTGDFNDHCRF